VGFEPTERSSQFLQCSSSHHEHNTALTNTGQTLGKQKACIREHAIVSTIVVSEYKGIYKQRGSKNYFTAIRCFDSKTGKWKRRIVSTHTSDPLTALKTREELQALEDAINKNSNSDLTRAKAFETVNALLKWHQIPGIEDNSPSIITIGDFAETWLADIRKTGGISSWRACKSHSSSFREFVGADTILAAITRRNVQDWYNELVDFELKPATISGYLKSIRRLFRDAEDEGIIEKIPTRKIKTIIGTSRAKEPFSLHDISELLRGVSEFDDPGEWRIATLFGLCLGARINDCTIRRWEEIEIGGNIPNLKYIPEKTKRKNVIVKAPLVDPLLSALRSLQQKKEGFITPALAVKRASGRNSLSSQFEQLVKDSDIELRHETGEGKGIDWFSKSFHSFRHTLPSLMAASNVPEQIRMGIVGHTRLETHLGYTHHDDEQMRAALELSLSSVEEI